MQNRFSAGTTCGELPIGGRLALRGALFVCTVLREKLSPHDLSPVAPVGMSGRRRNGRGGRFCGVIGGAADWGWLGKR